MWEKAFIILRELPGMTFSNISFFILLLIAHLLLINGLFYFEYYHYIILLFVGLVQVLISTTLYHRYYSHNSWKCPNWFKIIGTIVGSYGLTGSPISRTAAHINHHKYSDTHNDSHSPAYHGLIRTYFPQIIKRKKAISPILVKRFVNDPFIMFIHRHYITIIVFGWLLSIILFGYTNTIAWLIGPGVLCWVNISLCNMFCHKKKKANIMIRNNKLLALITCGEGYHLTHHNNPKLLKFGEYDIGYIFICLIKKIDSYI